MLTLLKRSRFAALLLAFTAFALTPLAMAADTVTLKNGEVLEGDIEREGDGFLYLRIEVGGVSYSKFILKDDIKSIERDDAGEDAKPADSAPANTPTRAQERRNDGRQTNTGDAVRVAFITLGDPPDKDMVGPFMNADALSRSIEILDDLPEQERPQIVVLKINSGGGALFEIQKLSDVIEDEIKPKYRTIAWIESAISAAAMTAVTIEDIYFMRKGNLGAATGFRVVGGKAEAVEGRQLEEVLYMMERISKRGNYNPLVMRAMQIEQPLSADIDEDGVVTWRPDLEGQYIVNTKDRILTFNSQDAMRFRFAKGVADTKSELMSLLIGDTEWVEVGHAADAYQREFRDNVFVAQTEVNELRVKLNLAMEAASSARSEQERGRHIGSARRYLSQMRSWVRKAPSLEVYQGLTPEWFREVEKQIQEFASGGRRR